MADYGSTSEVGALQPRYAGSVNDFADTERPTAATVSNWLSQVSSMLNGVLAQEGFTVPITDTDIKPALDAFVNGLVAEMVLGVNGIGRFGPRTDGRASPPRYGMINDDIVSFVSSNAYGWEQMGAERTDDTVASIAFRDLDEGGDEVTPIFQRGAFGASFKEWDPD